ncbi:hypothetical protein P0082_04320 [Candidatus Haliotispira prima]|uniref:Uncharacterized protein n=1 Tax=Candidatus Haliotispira prima TaxID=3034016 RepID=A0ABY8MJ94_9SPIO|nr:hypothetical protein P0082_04320 [Candidatus Haliotispira prima]
MDATRADLESKAEQEKAALRQEPEAPERIMDREHKPEDKEEAESTLRDGEGAAAGNPIEMLEQNKMPEN